ADVVIRSWILEEVRFYARRIVDGKPEGFARTRGVDQGSECKAFAEDAVRRHTQNGILPNELDQGIERGEVPAVLLVVPDHGGADVAHPVTRDPGQLLLTFDHFIRFSDR